jgi:hypothetical protein
MNQGLAYIRQSSEAHDLRRLLAILGMLELTAQFLRWKVAEYEILKVEIEGVWTPMEASHVI